MFRNNTNKQWDKNIIKVIRPLENLGIFLKRTNKKIISQERDYSVIFMVH